MDSLEGKIAVVTGAGDGIGRAEALTLAAHGAAVIVNDLGSAADDVAALIRSSGGRAVANVGDVSSWKTTADLVNHAIGEFGGLDIVVTNAGVCHRNAIADLTEDECDRQVGVLFKGTLGLLHHASAYWRSAQRSGQRRRRSIVITSSSAGVPGGVQEFAVYGAMKAAVAATTLTAALEMRPFGVHCNAILPHAATRMDAAAKGLTTVQQFADDDCRPMNPRHVANVVTYLASEQSAWLTGQVFEITGTTVRRWTPWAPAGEVETEGQWTADALDEALAGRVYGTIPSGRVIARKPAGVSA